MKQVRRQMEEVRKQLVQAKEERQRKLEYDNLAQVINTLPSREHTLK